MFKNVPAHICANCGEEYVSVAVSQALLSRAQKEWADGIIFEMRNFAA